MVSKIMEHTTDILGLSECTRPVYSRVLLFPLPYFALFIYLLFIDQKKNTGAFRDKLFIFCNFFENYFNPFAFCLLCSSLSCKVFSIIIFAGT